MSRGPFKLTTDMQTELEELIAAPPTSTAIPERVLAPRDPLLAERQTTHGNFAANAAISQMLKRVYRSAPSWEGLTDIERESLDMMALKFSRILSGKSQERQHWEDVVGYAKLALEQCP